MAPALTTGTFRALRTPNFRIWWFGTIVSNIGTWMQRIAQDWLVLTVLTHRNATAVGVVTALQYAPQLLLLPWTGAAADRLDRRRLLMVTQGIMGVLALTLGTLTVTGLVRLWQVDIFGFLLGCTAAFDAPSRQAFVSDLVDDRDLSNAVSLNSTSFNAARMVGPAVAGAAIAAFGTGPAFLANGASFFAVLVSLRLLRRDSLRPRPRRGGRAGGFVAGLRYVGTRPDLVTILIVLFLLGTFGLNFAIFISTMAVKVFHENAAGFGLLNSALAVGALTGALTGARRAEARFGLVLGGVALFGAAALAAALMPNPILFALALAVAGFATLTVMNASNSLMQVTSDPGMRGRVMSLRLAVTLGGGPIGAPLIGWIADRFGPRWALGVGAASGFAGALVALAHLARMRRRPGVAAGGIGSVAASPVAADHGDP